MHQARMFHMSGDGDEGLHLFSELPFKVTWCCMACMFMHVLNIKKSGFAQPVNN